MPEIYPAVALTEGQHFPRIRVDKVDIVIVDIVKLHMRSAILTVSEQTILKY